MTSPPYYGLRDYGVESQISLEETPAEFIARLVAVFREVCRILCDDGTMWVNIGDSYVSKPNGTLRGDALALCLRAAGRRLVFEPGHHQAQADPNA